MNTFIPFPDFESSVAFLDDLRLNKQMAEGAQIIRQLEVWPHGAWAHHPAILMWLGHSDALFRYLQAVEDERLRRGFNSHTEWWNLLDRFPEFYRDMAYELPSWWGTHAIHQSHYDNLLLKFAGKPHGDYVWPVSFLK